MEDDRPYELGPNFVWGIIRKGGFIFDDVFNLAETEETAKAICEDWNKENYYERWGHPGYEVVKIPLVRMKI